MAAAKKAAEVAKSKVNVAAAIAAIQKVTGQKPIGSTEDTFPHIPSGVLAIDNLLGGTPLSSGKGMICPGYARGRIIEVYGAESSGKTTLALGAMVATRKAGGTCMFLDFENAIHFGYAKNIGVTFNDTDTLYYAPDTLEDGFKMLYIAIKTGFDLVVVDSVAAMVPKKELEKKLGDPAAIGALARAMAENLGKLVQWQKQASNTCLMLLNQVRSLISAGAGDNETTAGGKAVKFYCTHRLKLTRIRSDFIEKKDPVTLKKRRFPYGNVVQVKSIKNKLDGKQGHTAEIFIRYGQGIDEYLSLIEGAIPRKIITQKGAAYAFGAETFKGKESVRKYLLNNPKATQDLRDKIHKALLEEKPEALSADEIDEDDIVSDLRAELGDDDLADTVDEAAIEQVLTEEETSSEGS